MPGSLLERLGFRPNERVVIVHADDLGMCHAANAAFWEAQAYGIVTCGSVMMPCPWVAEMAAWYRAHPQADVGVHITLTSEWDRLRWRPLSTCDPQSGLIDREGYMWRSNQPVYARMDADADKVRPAAVAEMRTQIEFALSLGMDVTHMDTHMGTVMHPQLLPAYVQLAVEYRIPAMLLRISEERMAEWGVSVEMGRALLAQLDALIGSGFPVLDHICAAREQERSEASSAHLDVYKRLFDSVPAGITHLLLHPSVPAGITHLLLHPSVPGFDIEAIADSAAHRIQDYQTFLRPELKDYVAAQGIHLIGYRRLRDLMRG